jgi:hypothetical protein
MIQHHFSNRCAPAFGLAGLVLTAACLDEEGTSSNLYVPATTVTVVHTVFVPTPGTVAPAPVNTVPAVILQPTAVPSAEPELLVSVASEERAVPILGGTLSIDGNGKALVVDPDRDQLSIVDVAAGSLERTIAFADGDEPGRLVENTSGSAFVVLRRGAAVAEIDVAEGVLLRRHAVCAAPRGIAYDAERDLVVVACFNGELALIAADGSSTRLQLNSDDLRDVVIESPYYLVSRFKGAQVLVVNPDTGVVHDVLSPHGFNEPSVGNLVPSAGFRLSPISSGRVMLQHQRANQAPLVPVYYGPEGCVPGIVHSMVSVLDAAEYPPQVTVETTEAEQNGGSGSSSLGDAGSDAGSDAGRVAPAAVSSYVPAARSFRRFVAPSAERITDFAVDASAANYVAITNAGPTSEVRTSKFFEVVDGDCEEELAPAQKIDGQASAVAFAPDGTVLVQTREPAALHILAASGPIVVALSDSSRADTGHFLFHAKTTSGLACSSCHPEGGEDGNTWNFVGLGQRRTQVLWGGLLGTAPFHWVGEHADMQRVLDDTLTARMRGPTNLVLPEDAAARLGSWLDTIKAPLASAPLDETLSRGRAAFEKADCHSCHSGGSFTDNLSHDVGTGGLFQTPSLLGLAFRSPYLHNGCAKTIAERFTPCGGTTHGKNDLLNETEMEDLVAYLESL